MGIVERKERERQLRLTQILDAAKKLFKQKGYSQTKMQDIADKAELSRRTLYMYFKTKEDIAHDIIKETGVTIKSLLKVASDSGETGREKLEMVAMAFIGHFEAHPEGYLLLLNSDLNMLSSFEGAQRISSLVEKTITFLVNLLSLIYRCGLEDGTLKNNGQSIELSAYTMVTSILGTMKVSALQESFDKDSSAPFSQSLVLNNLVNMLTSSLFL